MFDGLKRHYANLLTSGGHLVLLAAGWQIGTPEAWLTVLGLIASIGFLAWIGNHRRSRLILDTPTSRIASAAQGYVELAGQSRQASEPPLFSKLKQMPCVWYRYTIEQRRNDDKGYETVESGESDDTFLIDDGSGQCFVDPEHAEILTTHKQVWHESDYRYTEYRLVPGETLYALGEFATLGGANSDLDFKGDLDALLTEWKRDQPALLKRFDLDEDGRIDASEWELALLAAKREVSRQHREIRLKDGVHLMRKPADGRLFLLSNLPEEKLAQKYVLWGWFHLLSFFAAGGTAVWMLAG